MTSAAPAYHKFTPKRLAPFALLMGALVALSNLLVAFPVSTFLTWAAFTYPLTFLVLDIANRHYGPRAAALVTAAGFAVGLPLSLAVAETRIALASLAAYLIGQALDIGIFHKLRAGLWWRAPLVSSIFATIGDGFLFFALAFAYSGVNWMPLFLGDTAVKLLVVLCGLPLYRQYVLRCGLETATQTP